MLIKLSSNGFGWAVERQTPGRNSKWEDALFSINTKVEKCDAWVVYDNLSSIEQCVCPPSNTLLITGEPPSVLRYKQAFIRQFATVLSCHAGLSHPQVIIGQQALPWHIGIQRNSNTVAKDYDDLRSSSIEKTKLISVISSNQTLTEGHRQRLLFVDTLMKEFGSEIDIFGRGLNEVNDKWDAIAPYKYHIAIENSSYPHYWTEKLADCYLGLSFPIYYGAPNLKDYFSPDSFMAIDIREADIAVERIRKAIIEKKADQSSMDVMESRNRVLDRYNIFPVVVSILRKLSWTSNLKNRKYLKIFPQDHWKYKFRK